MNYLTKIHSPRCPNNKKGVTIVFFVMCLGVMLGFFLMTVNSGILVYQKIRLQSAVDLAAYAAAAVQASYLDNKSDPENQIRGSGDTSIRAINAKIFQRYGELIEEMKFGTIAPAPGFGLPPTPDIFSCAALCQVANQANGKHAANIYHKAVDDINEYRIQIARILTDLPKASRRAAEQTMALNIPELFIDEKESGGSFGDTTNKFQDVIDTAEEDANNPSFNASAKKTKNAILTFQSAKGMYLANVVGSVPHTFAYFGPFCFNANDNPQSWPLFYCAVNGTGAPGGMGGYASAALAFSRSKIKDGPNGNIGHLAPLINKDAKAIRLMFMPNYHKPDPFTLVAAEWYPKNGSYANLENSLGAKGSLFPRRTRLVAMAEAEPFGGNLLESGAEARGFGVRLAAIRKALLDPRLQPVKDDYPGMFEYLHSFSARDEQGKLLEEPEAIIKKFLH